MFCQFPFPLFIAILCLAAFADCFGLGRKGPPKRSEDLDADRALNRTLAKILTNGEHGRFILLVCRTKCLKERAEVSNWVREFNTRQNKSRQAENDAAAAVNQSSNGAIDEPLGFHFHFYKRPFPVTDIERAMKGPQQSTTAFYIVGSRAFPMGGQIGKKEKFIKWLDTFEHPRIVTLEDGQIDGWLNSQCHGDVPIQRSEKQMEICPATRMLNLARSFADRPNFTMLELRRPMSEEDDFLFHWRLPSIGDICRMDILLVGQHFLELPPGIMGFELHQIVNNLTSKGNAALLRSCAINSTETVPFDMQKILPPLTPIEIEFLRDEMHLKAIEHNKQYLTVGAIGGVAVMALAMSIFWGLNGNDFVPKQ